MLLLKNLLSVTVPPTLYPELGSLPDLYESITASDERSNESCSTHHQIARFMELSAVVCDKRLNWFRKGNAWRVR